MVRGGGAGEGGGGGGGGAGGEELEGVEKVTGWRRRRWVGRW